MQLKDIVPGWHYKYRGIWGLAGLWNNELMLYGNADSSKIADLWKEYNPKLTEEIAAELQEWPRPNIEHGRKAKEIALEMAIKYLSASPVPPCDADKVTLMDYTETIYQWLIK